MFFHPIHVYPPGYPIFLSIPLILADNIVTIHFYCQILNVILTSLIIFPIYSILCKYVDKKLSLYGVIIVGLLPSIVVLNSAIMSENLQYFFFYLIIWLYLHALENNQGYKYFIVGFMCVFASITHGDGIVIFISIMMSYVFFLFYYRPNYLQTEHSLLIIHNTKTRFETALKYTGLGFILFYGIWRIYAISHSAKTYNLNKFVSPIFSSLLNNPENFFSTIISLVISQINGYIITTYIIFFSSSLILIYLIFLSKWKTKLILPQNKMVVSGFCCKSK